MAPFHNSTKRSAPRSLRLHEIKTNEAFKLVFRLLAAARIEAGLSGLTQMTHPHGRPGAPLKRADAALLDIEPIHRGLSFLYGKIFAGPIVAPQTSGDKVLENIGVIPVGVIAWVTDDAQASHNSIFPDQSGGDNREPIGLGAPEALDVRRRVVGARITDALMNEARLDDASARGADFNNTNLNEASLRRGDFTGANFSDCGLASAQMREGRFVGARFVDADLFDADLGGADLRDADFSGARLTRVNLEGAKLDNAIFKGALMPDGTEHP